ncbi:MAG: NUDIX domain-containing protein [Candidatus Aenigmarchaeota archaeon]|nr:NUDIX domain-containing protein [Candidatus Aenigmarchaeota archaeon]
MPIEVSAGGFVWDKKSRKMLLILDSYGKWAVPKGLIEKGETPEQAALREVKEETGIEAKILEKLGENKYFYRRDGKTIAKTVHVFLMGGTGEIKVQWEIKGAEWVELKEVLERIGYNNLKELAEKALEAIKMKS